MINTTENTTVKYPELRIYDVEGIKRFVLIDTEKLLASLNSQNLNEHRCINGCIREAVAKSILYDDDITNSDYYTPPHYFTIELGTDLPHRYYEKEYYERENRFHDRIYNTWWGKLLEKIMIFCDKQLRK